MIDLHSHLLPGLDHGASNWEEALEMCRIAVADGITTIAATPHVSEVFPNRPEQIEGVVAQLRLRLAQAGLPLAVVTGGDYHIHPDLSPATVLTLGGNGRYFLLEFPFQVLPLGAAAFVRTLLGRGLSPIITHPERMAPFQHHWKRLGPLIQAGALVQVTGGSLLGDFGPAARSTAQRLLKQGWVHLLASDAHWAQDRVPRLAGARDAAARIVGAAAAQALVLGNPAAVLEGREIART